MTETSSSRTPTLGEIRATLDMLETWEERYGFIIDLGRSLPPLEERTYVRENLVQGCTSQVWLVKKIDSHTGAMTLQADSDAFIVRGLIALLLALFNGKTIAEARAVPVEKIFTELGLEEHLSPIRRNGFFAIVEGIRN